MIEKSETAIDVEYLIYLENIEKKYHALDHNFTHWKDKIVYPKSPDYYVSLQTNCMVYMNQFFKEHFNIDLNVSLLFTESVQDSEQNNAKNVHWKAEVLEDKTIEIKIARIKVIYEIALNVTPMPYLELVMRSIGGWLAKQKLSVEEFDKRVAQVRKRKGNNFILFEDDYIEGTMLSIPGIFNREFLPPLAMLETLESDDLTSFHEGKPYAYHFDTEDDSIEGLGVPEILAPMCVYLKSQKQINRSILNAQIKNLNDFKRINN